MTISRNLSFLAEGVSSTGVLGATYGGTGQSSITTGDLLYGSASNTISKLAIGSTGTILRVVGGVPSWGTDYTGTVTSVAATVPSFLSISGSPITTSGTLAITLSGTALPVANGGTGVTTSTGSVNTVLSTSPTLTTPIITTTIGVGGATPSASGSGVTFPATQSDSSNANTLDDYEEGTWTPVPSPASGSITSYTSSGRYTKIGNQVTVTFTLSITNAGTAVALSYITGLPFTTNASAATAVGVMRENNYTGLLWDMTAIASNTVLNTFNYANSQTIVTGYAFNGSTTYLI